MVSWLYPKGMKGIVSSVTLQYPIFSAMYSRSWYVFVIARYVRKIKIQHGMSNNLMRFVIRDPCGGYCIQQGFKIWKWYKLKIPFNFNSSLDVKRLHGQSQDKGRAKPPISRRGRSATGTFEDNPTTRQPLEQWRYHRHCGHWHRDEELCHIPD